jgi:RNA polymerase sigma factor (sigma-70 family)
MITPSRSDVVPEDEQLARITTLARRFAARIVAEHVVDDLAQDIVLECLVAMREGRWRVSMASLRTHVRRLVRRRAVDWLRRAQRRKQREVQHGRAIEQGTHAWMSPELTLEERELTSFHAQTLASLPDACRRT